MKLKKTFYEITLELSSGIGNQTFLVRARNPQSAIKKAVKKAHSAFFYPIGKVLHIKEFV